MTRMRTVPTLTAVFVGVCLLGVGAQAGQQQRGATVQSRDSNSNRQDAESRAVSTTRRGQSSDRPTNARLTLEAIARDPAKWIGTSPSQVRWSEDGRSIYFMANPEAKDEAELYVIGRDGGEPKLVPAEQRRLIPSANAEVNKARTQKTYELHGDIYVITLADSTVRRLTDTDGTERNPHFTFDGTGVTFERDQNLFLVRLDTGNVQQLTNFRTGKDPDEKPKQTKLQEYLEKQQLEMFEYLQKTERIEKERKERERLERGTKIEPRYLKDTERVSELQLSPDGKVVTFILSDRAEAQAGKVTDMPKYVTKSGFVEMQSLATGAGGARVKAGEPVARFKLGALDTDTGEISWIDHGQGDRAINMNAPVWSEDGRHAVAWAGSIDHKDGWLLLLDLPRTTTRVVMHEHDDAWVRGFRTGRLAAGDDLAYGWMPDNASVYFTSERDGFNHLYVSSLQGGTPRALTAGRFEISDVTLSKDKQRWYFVSTEVHPTEHQVYAMPVAGGARSRLTPKTGWYSYSLSPDEQHLALLYGAPVEPTELFVMPNTLGAVPQQLTTTTKPEFRNYAWQASELVSFDDGEGHTIHAEVWKPARPHPSRPAIIQVHGSGWAQGVSRRWSNGFPFFHYLVQEGYTVMNVDYRGSRGYGRDFRTAIYREMGNTEIKSAIAAADYLVKNYKIDRQRIGLFGASYGGFFTLMALFKYPGVFAAGAAHAPVTDWAHYNHGYTSRILNAPYEDDEAYRRSSPIYFAEGLKDHLLITHGVQDDNVHFQDSVRLTERLMELRKDNWDMMLYPVEPHGFVQEWSRLDEMKRRVKLFDRVLKGPRPSATLTDQE